jgi:protein phosphatase
MSQELVMAGLTDPGRMREENEDCIAVHPTLGVAVLADGMGGHQAGEVASRMAVDVVSRHFQASFANAPKQPTASKGGISFEAKTLSEAIEIANTAIHAMARERPECAGMGSTVVVAVFHEDRVCVGHVGDSRLYRFRAGKLEQITHDHSVVEELVARGLMSRDDARQAVGKNLVTRALGVDPFVTPDITEVNQSGSDLYLLCSDGLNDVVSDEEIMEALANAGDDLQKTAKRLVEIANLRGGPDNISVIVVRSTGPFVRTARPS